jgi:protease-4
LKLVKLSAYSKVPEKKTYKGLARNKIAVIYASGDVVMGDEKQNNIGSEGIAETIRKARKDKNVKAIVFRVNSGGGSALASEVIWRELDLAKKAKPVIASFGDVAASGGYFIACPADTIVAEPTTITGSIGVFGVLLNSKEFLNKKLGITVDVYKTNDYSDFASVYRPLSPLEKQFFQISIDTFYNTFISHVAEGRGMEKSAVDSIGEGRVWSGINAKQIGLIDVFGGLTKAIDIAKEKAGLENYRIEELPEQVDPFQQIMNQLSEEVKVKILSNELGSSYKYFKFLKNIESYNGIQARLPYEISIY